MHFFKGEKMLNFGKAQIHGRMETCLIYLFFKGIFDNFHPTQQFFALK